MNPLRHLLHRHTTATRADAGHIVLCHRARRVDAHVHPAGATTVICLHDISMDELAELVRAAGSPHRSGPAAERLLYVANAIRMRRRANHPAGRGLAGAS